MKKRLRIFAAAAAVLMLLTACGAKEEPAETTTEPLTDGVSVVYYHGDESASYLVEETTLLPKLTAQALLDLLSEQKIIPEGTRVRNFQLSQGTITLDLSREFEEGIQGLGTSGEYMMLGSLVNTFLRTYEASGLELTTEGRDLQTGHNVYDEVLKFFE